MKRHIIDQPKFRSGEHMRAFLRIARSEMTLPERRAIYRNSGKPASPERAQQFLRIERGHRA